jgi:hypothetical protein
MRILEMHKNGMLEWDEKVHNEYRSNDDALLEILKTDSLVDEALNDWFKYIKKETDIEQAFFGKPKKGVGDYASRWKKQHDDNDKTSLFQDLIFFSHNKWFFPQKTISERLYHLLTHEPRWKDEIHEHDSLMREYRRWRKNVKYIKTAEAHRKTSKEDL